MTEGTWSASWQASDVEIQKEEIAYNGFYQIKKIHLRHRCFNGEWSDVLIREQMRRQDAAAILLFDPQQDKVVLVEQFRTGLLGKYAHQSPWLLEIVAGLLEPEEDPLQTAIREAKEEANCEIKECIKIGEFYNSPGGFAEKTYLYCGIVDATGAGGIHGVGSEHEDIQVHVLASEYIFNAIETGKYMTSASTLIALQWLKGYRKTKR